MKVEVEEISATERRIVVEIPSERVTSEYEHAYLDVARHATVKGFRKGKVPRKVLEQRFGDDVRTQVTQTLVQEGFSRGLEELKLDIVSQPELDFEPPVSGELLRLSAKVEIRPELGEVDISGLAVQRPEADVADEEVEKVLEQIRDRHGELAPVEDRKELASGDYAMIAIVAQSEGEKVDALSVEGGAHAVAAEMFKKAVAVC